MFNILLIEDNPGDIRLTKEAFKKLNVKTTLHVAVNGLEAYNFLLKKEKYADSLTPDLIILDLNIPKKDGRELLQFIKQDKTLRHLPLVIFSISCKEREILEAYRLHANCFICKPDNWDLFSETIKILGEFWFSVVTLPKIL